ncbi:spermatogenesis-associated protein 20 [Phlyctochytrium bullatum]|nr:spermatogenesis-associated protein 20 [Phlyctochytrium bullatum]
MLRRALRTLPSRPLVARIAPLVQPPAPTVPSLPYRIVAPQSSVRFPARQLATAAATEMPNRLAQETSPYLLQHCNDPVDWYAWGEEAFAKAREENKPILLSVGYSTCHWCGVMHKESFKNPRIAALMNEYFVNIKVDREERPTVDRLYMTFVQALTGHGGWPMTVLLTPSLKPFFGGTYFAPEDKYGNPGFPKVLKYFGEKWNNDQEELVTSSDKIMEDLRRMSESGSGAEAGKYQLTLSMPEKGYKRLEATYDDELGGFGGHPKFPTPVIFHFLLRYYGAMNVPPTDISHVKSPATSAFELQRLAKLYGVNLPTEDMSGKMDELRGIVGKGLESRKGEARKALEMVDFTLRQIARGGIHDHVGTGFHRYSVDKYWHVPHFEKMLYDQAQLLSAYVDMHLILKQPIFEEVARDIIKYVTRDLSDPEGAFYSAEDADSLPTHESKEKVEGAFCVWEGDEIRDALGEDAAVFSTHYGVLPGGNVMASSDPHGELNNKNVLIERNSIEETAIKHSLSPEEVRNVLKKCREKLWDIRLKRPKPHRDDKVIVSWNGLMLGALAKASRAFTDPTILHMATRCAVFIRTHMYDAEARTLIRTLRNGVPSNVPACADDYAFLISGLIELYEASLELKWLRWAVDLQETMDKVFWDAKDGGYFTGREDDKSVLLRMKDDYDGAEPTTNSISVTNLLKLDGILPAYGVPENTFNAESEFKKRAEKILLANIETLARQPRALPFMVTGCLGYLRGMREIILHGDLTDATTADTLRFINTSKFHPFSSLLHVPLSVPDPASTEGADFAWLRQLNPNVDSIASKPLDPGASCEVFACEAGVCGMPAVGEEEVKRLVEE